MLTLTWNGPNELGSGCAAQGGLTPFGKAALARMEELGIASPVLGVEADYLRMVRFGDTVSIRTRMKEYNGIKLTLEYEVTDENTGMVHCRGLTKHCFLNEKGRPVSLKKDYPDIHALFVGVMGQEK